MFAVERQIHKIINENSISLECRNEGASPKKRAVNLCTGHRKFPLLIKSAYHRKTLFVCLDYRAFK